ncbi:hypothetical protein [Verrucosispora sioxanthis]|uniref:Uncharacterized protein n=1 Tax=Verrucosispora sioxanthis TaxID=2499994 RepID=A0A6M1KWQ9_9ACTN|nr:hypothetical protein [Verrucosispora sioxanthis]NEE63279.1 hypothetical protein [Verrucosispora sioxanthis]NGM12389.1 hypothetical protein [Verrucosispora sioxanthis]
MAVRLLDRDQRVSGTHFADVQRPGHDDRMRNVEELKATSDPAWPALEMELLSNPQINILPVSAAVGHDSLYRFQARGHGWARWHCTPVVCWSTTAGCVCSAAVASAVCPRWRR